MSENDKLREALDRLLRAYLVMRIEPPEPGHSDFSAVQQAREALAASKPHNAPSIDTCDLGHKFAKLADHPKKDGVARCPHCMATGLDSERAASKPEQNDRLCDALETIRSIAEWMNVSVQCVQNHPEEPPDYASEFDYKLAQASSELFNAIEIFDAQALAASKPEPQSTMVDKQSTKPEPQARAAEPDYWHAECDDPDYSAFFPDKADAMARASDHGGTVTPYINHDKFVAAIAKRDAALDACVEALRISHEQMKLYMVNYKPGWNSYDGNEAAITKAQEARKS